MHWSISNSNVHASALDMDSNAKFDVDFPCLDLPIFLKVVFLGILYMVGVGL